MLFRSEEPPTIDGEPVDQGVIDDMDDFDDKVFRGDFSDLDFSGKVLDKAILAGAKFDRSKFSGVRFNGVKAWHASFIGADFTNAHFAGADLSYGIFKDATFTGAAMPGGSFTTVGATFDGARWVNGVKICAEGSVGTCN